MVSFADIFPGGGGPFADVFAIALTPPLGVYMARVYTGRRVFLSSVLVPVERLTYRVLRVDPTAEQS